MSKTDDDILFVDDNSPPVRRPCIDSSWTCGTSTFETFYLNFISIGSYMRKTARTSGRFNIIVRRTKEKSYRCQMSRGLILMRSERCPVWQLAAGLWKIGDTSGLCIIGLLHNRKLECTRYTTSPSIRPPPLLMHSYIGQWFQKVR